MIAGFTLTLFLNNSTITMLLQNGFEAGLVGGLADWFAVSALFRHPFGIPIPHTALLPKNRQRITNGLISIVENNLLNKSSVLNKVQKLDFVRKFLDICKNKLYSNEVKSGITHVIKRVIDSFSITNASVYLHSLISKYLNTLDTKKLLEVLINACLQHNYEQKIFDILIDKLEEAVKREEIKKEIGSMVLSTIKKLQVKGMVQYALNTVASIVGEDKIGSTIQDFIILILKELKNIDNPSRLMALNSIRANIKHISNDENIIQKINKYRENLTNNDEFHYFVVQTLNKAKSTILSYINDDSYMEKNVLPLLDDLISKLSADVELVNKLEQYIQEQIYNYINNNHEKIGKLVKENIEKLDNKTLTYLIEDKVGDDLQWIRVNGAICGFLIGLVLGGIKLLGAVRV